MSPKEERESWSRYQKVILSELANHSKTLESLVKAVQVNNDATSDIKVKMATMNATIEAMKSDSERIDALETKQNEMNRELGESKVTAGLWGSISGAVTAVAGAIAYFMSNGGK